MNKVCNNMHKFVSTEESNCNLANKNPDRKPHWLSVMAVSVLWNSEGFLRKCNLFLDGFLIERVATTSGWFGKLFYSLARCSNVGLGQIEWSLRRPRTAALAVNSNHRRLFLNSWLQKFASGLTKVTLKFKRRRLNTGLAACRGGFDCNSFPLMTP